MRPGMLDDILLSPGMIIPRQHPASVHATCSTERLTTHMANTGEDVEALGMLLESACYRERADVRSSYVLQRRVRHVGAICGRGHKQITVEAVTALRSLDKTCCEQEQKWLRNSRHACPRQRWQTYKIRPRYVRCEPLQPM